MTAQNSSKWYDSFHIFTIVYAIFFHIEYKEFYLCLHYTSVFFLQISDLDGSNTFIEPNVNNVDIGTVIVKILSSNGPTSISRVDLTVCCHEKG